MPNRYARTKLNTKPIDMHRKVMQLAIGRPLLHDEYVHHKNENKRDNDIGNLEIMSPVEHAVLHLQKYPLDKTCVVCGAVFTPHKTKRKRQQTCSQLCARELSNRNVWNRRLSDEDKGAIRARREAGEKLLDIAKDYGISASTVSEVALRKRNYA